MYILLGSVVIDILLTLTGQCSHTMLIIGTSLLLCQLPDSIQNKLTLYYTCRLYSLRKRYLIIISLSYMHGYMTRCVRHKSSQQT